MQPTLAEVTQLVWEIRRFLEPHWVKAHLSWGAEIPQPPSRWMCRSTSIFLAEVFRTQLGSVWQIVGGRPEKYLDATPEGAVGIFATNGTWNDHCWLEENGLVVDLTADQFGHPTVIITAADALRYRANLSEQDMAEDLLKLRSRSIAWLAAWNNRQPQ